MKMHPFQQLQISFQRLPWWAKLVVFVIAAYGVLRASFAIYGLPAEPPEKYTPEMPVAIVPAKDVNLEEEACKSSITAKIAEYDALYKVGMYWDAHLSVNQCAQILKSSDLIARANDAEVKSYLADIRNSKTSASERLRLMELLVTAHHDHPEVGNKFDVQIGRLSAQIGQQEKAAEARRKRAQGVSIGMTKEDVLASSWGRPESVNTTVTAHGTHEQWVYGGNNFLYFDNGILSTVQK